MSDQNECLFCQIAKGQSPAKIVWENEHFLTIENKYPKAPVHVLVIPKSHTSKTDLVSISTDGFWDQMMKAVFETIRILSLDKSGYKLVNNGGGYNHFDHEHIHVMGGSKTEPGGET